MESQNVELTKYFDHIVIDERGTLHLSNPNYDHIENDKTEFAQILKNCMKRDKSSDEAIGELMGIFKDIQVIFDDVKYPENIMLNVIFNIIHKPFIPGEGVGLHMNLGLKQCIKKYIRGLSEEEKEVIRGHYNTSINVKTGEWSCDLERLEQILRYVDESKQYAIVMEFTKPRKGWNEQELKEMFNQRAEEINESSKNDEDFLPSNTEFIFPMTDVKIREDHVIFSFDAEAPIIDAIAHGVIADYKYIQMWIELNGGNEANFENEDDKRKLAVYRKKWEGGDKEALIKDYCPPHVIKFVVKDGKCFWTERHMTTLAQFKDWINMPEKSPNNVTVTW